MSLAGSRSVIMPAIGTSDRDLLDVTGPSLLESVRTKATRVVSVSHRPKRARSSSPPRGIVRPQRFSAKMSDLPLLPELLHEVFDHLEPSAHSLSSSHAAPWSGSFRIKSDLYSCSLVSRDWNRLTRPHLFHFVRYSFRRSPKEGEVPWGPLLLDGILGRWEENITTRTLPCPNKTLGMLCKFLESNPAVAPYIRGLSLRCCAGARRPEVVSHGGHRASPYSSDDRIHPSLLARLLALLPQLHTLHLENVVLACAPTNQALSCPPLRTLDVLFLMLRPSSRDTSALLGCFKDVGELKLTNPGTDNHPYGGGTIPSSIDEYDGPEYLNVRTLSIDSLLEPVGGLFDSLCRRGSSTNIRALNFLYVSSNTTPQLQAFVNAIGNQLEQVQYDLSTTASALDCNFGLAILDLSQCTALRRLTISLYLDLDYAGAPNVNFLHMSRLLRRAALSRISNPVFEAIVLDVTNTMRYYPYTAARGLDAGRKPTMKYVEPVDDVMGRIMRQFPDMKVIVTGPQDVEAQNIVATSFPSIAQERKFVFSGSSTMPV